jgi:hypothetical protein
LDASGADKAPAARPILSSQVLKDYFTQRGVDFTDANTAIAFDRRGGKLIVKNTPENLRRLEVLLRDLDIETPLVNMQFDMIEMAYDDLEKITAGMKSAEQFGSKLYQAVLRSEKGKISSQRIIATSGQPALARKVIEKYFPNSWIDPELVFDKDMTSFTPPYPELGEATELGQRLEATATVSPNNYIISLNLHPRLREQSGWTEYPYELVQHRLTEKTVLQRNKVKMPEFFLRDITTNVKAYDGETLLIGKAYFGFDPGKESFFAYKSSHQTGKVVLFFVTPVLVSPDGNPVRK